MTPVSPGLPPTEAAQRDGARPVLAGIVLLLLITGGLFVYLNRLR
jgi:hypothetical protein